jgi:uncharacterized protein (TIGR00106 family)
MLTIIASIEVIPIGTTSTSLSPYVALAVKELRKIKGIKFQVGPMSTSIEARTLDELLKAVKVSHEAAFKAGAKRVMTTLTVDDRRDVKHVTMLNKVKAIEQYLERT